MNSDIEIERGYALAKEKFAGTGVDTDKAMKQLARIPISLHSWQGDDVHGFENSDGITGGGILATGAYPGRARTGDELRADLKEAMSLIPGSHRVALQAIHAECVGSTVDRNKLTPEHFSAWVDWAKENKIGMDFNGSFFSHRFSDGCMTLANADDSIRKFWIEHAIASRRIGEYFGRELGTPCVTNLWIPDGSKDIPVDRKGPRQRLQRSLDEVFRVDIDKRYNLDALESKLFGIGLESYTVGSHEFYLGYAAKNNLLICLDSGHFHPTEMIADKISSTLTAVEGLMLHVSRGIRWDSDHIVILSDELLGIAQEIIRGNYFDQVHIGLDFFDASINRIAAWVIGARSMLKALLLALLEPIDQLRQLELKGDFTARLAILEEIKSLPFGLVWDYYCLKSSVPVGPEWLSEVRRYESHVTNKRI